VNIASRAAALSPGATDPLSTFEGSYTTHYLPNSQGKKVANKGPELVISVEDGESSTRFLGSNTVKQAAGQYFPNSSNWMIELDATETVGTSSANCRKAESKTKIDKCV
jgi:hypothetical protein